MQTSFVTIFSGSIANQSEQLCNARDLHAALKVETRFNDWISRRISEYGFEENQDFITIIPQRDKSGRGGDRRSKDYHLTIDTAKELAMVEKTEVGRQIRRYFIQCEKELRQAVSTNTPKSKTTAAERAGLRNAVNLLVSKKGLNYSEAYHFVHQRFNVESIEDLSYEQLTEAVEYVHRIILEGEVLDKDTAPTIMHMLAKLTSYAIDYRDIQQHMINQPDKISYWLNNFKNAPEKGFLFVFKPDINRDINEASILMHRYKNLIA